ncbi:uncharacterized protein BDR25DRAFT_233630 [Lindgomyces ingoldianus]|uniref:Uncharacterized protein n=1 Tax=Lindgomyces ingoldianus TaxID=673940 RepID=A0ACB6QP75_9PLEO|nr:uncharacterized protein BDR25DRAFT_233630 [Lindgomyces ingoldianus]KAF2467915.1 hypothetical protein BDR25DRAFT_233630 [Lindgomyces ingoldianus]
MTEINPEEVLARFEELSVLESEFEDVELQIIRKSDALHAPLFQQRAAVIAKIPHFWALVFEQSPPEVDNYILPSDSQVFADCLETLEVSRFEMHMANGSPRSFSIKFGFSENSYFEDKLLEKKFWYRKAMDGDEWQGLVSEPVKIHWKKGRDLTGGLTDAAYALYEARKKLLAKSNGNAKSIETSLPEYKVLAKMIEQGEDASNSFFAWFGFVSSWRWVSAEESEQANKLEKERMEKRKRGEKVEDEAIDEDDQDFQEVEVFPQGDELATIIAEDMWPSAIKYFKQAHEADDDDGSDLEIEDFDEEDDSDGEIDIRGLVGKGQKSKGSSESPPPKKQRKN